MGALKGGEQGLIFDAAMRYFAAGTPTGGQVDVRATSTDGKVTEFKADVRIDTPAEAEDHSATAACSRPAYRPTENAASDWGYARPRPPRRASTRDASLVSTTSHTITASTWK